MIGNEPNPRRRRRRRKAAPVKTIIRYRAKKNPSRRRRYARAAYAYTKGAIGGVHIGGALRSTLPLLIGALSAKFAAKKFTDDKGAEGDNWTWKNYGLALVGGFVAAVAASAIFKGRKDTAQKVMEGAFLLTAYKIFVNEIASSNDTLKTWFSDDDAAYPDMSGYMGAGDEQTAEPGDLWQGDGQTWVMGEDYQWRPVDGMNRVPLVAGLGDSLVPSEPRMGDSLEPVSPRMGFGEEQQRDLEIWGPAF